MIGIVAIAILITGACAFSIFACVRLSIGVDRAARRRRTRAEARDAERLRVEVERAERERLNMMSDVEHARLAAANDDANPFAGS